jgi:hypothetical protein
LAPLWTELFSLVNAGADLEKLLLMAVSDINDVPNAPAASSLTPKLPQDNALFLHGIRLLGTLQQCEAIELMVGTNEEADETSDPILRSAVQGRDLLTAAHDGYVFRARGQGEVTLLKRQKELMLRVFPEYVQSPEMAEVAQIFHLVPGRSTYRIKSELTGTNSNLPSPLGEDSLYLNMRSILQTMAFLSKGVCVPEEHICSGIAPVTRSEDGTPFDWTRITGGNFFVASGKRRPRDAETAVYYRGYWFWIRGNDVQSRAILAIVELLYALQDADRKTAGPLLTMPGGG